MGYCISSVIRPHFKCILCNQVKTNITILINVFSHILFSTEIYSIDSNSLCLTLVTEYSLTVVSIHIVDNSCSFNANCHYIHFVLFLIILCNCRKPLFISLTVKRNLVSLNLYCDISKVIITLISYINIYKSSLFALLNYPTDIKFTLIF